MPSNSQYEDIGTHTAIRILGSGHCGGVGAQRIEIKHTPHNYAYNIQHTTQSVQCTAKESEHTVPGMQGGPAAGGGALKIRHSALGHSRGVFALVGSSLSLRFHFAHCV